MKLFCGAFLLLTIFTKKAPSYMFDCVLKMPLEHLYSYCSVLLQFTQTIASFKLGVCILQNTIHVKGKTIHILEAVFWRCSTKQVFLKISENSQENTGAKLHFKINLQASACNLIKTETLAQVFSSEFCQIFKNSFFKEHLRTPASVICFIE